MASSSSQSKSIYTSPPEEQKQQDKFWQDIWEKEAVDEALPRFDVGSPSPALLKAIEDGDVPLGRAFVPGCGSGYDVTALAALGREVIGLEIAPGGVERARARLKSLDPPAAGPCRFDLGDFFTYPTDPPFDFIYDYTFLCALPLDLREKWAAKMKELLMTPGEGVLMTLIYPICDKEGGPPYKVSLELYRELLEAEGFVCKKLELLPSELCHRGRDGSGHWGGKSAIGLWSLHAAAADVGGSEKGDAKK